MTSAQVSETSVNVTNNNLSRDHSHPDDETTQTISSCVCFRFMYVFWRALCEIIKPRPKFNLSWHTLLRLSDIKATPVCLFIEPLAI